MFLRRVRVIMMLCLIIGGAAQPVLAGPGSCEKFNFPVNPENQVDWLHPVKVMKQDSSVYSDAETRIPIDDLVLDFNKSLGVLDVRGSRVKVRYLTSLTPLGWVERSNLLCALAPLKSSRSGLEQKLYIKTATEVRGEKPATVKAYPTPDLDNCHGQCQEISRFTGYFVFDESPESYLLSDSYRLDETTRLIGWVSKENGFIWDTAYGLRPKEDLVFADNHPLAGQERTICAYRSLDDALENRHCQPILGGKRWYRYPLRIPILDDVEQEGRTFYKVVLPLAGIGVDKVIAPDQFEENQGIEALLDMKQIDVMFLIDGTKSLTKHIAAIRGSRVTKTEGVVQQIIKTLQQDDNFREAQFRFGFRIYRDAFAGDKELGEGLPISGECTFNQETQKENIRQFTRAIDKVNVTDEYNDDYPENLFGGIIQAIRDLAHCPDRNHTKILFIIGDCGYDVDAQKRRGRQTLTAADIAERLKGDKRIVTFFLQTPMESASASDPDAYKEAYRLFTHQASDILDRLLPARLAREKKQYLITTDDIMLNRKIIAGIKGFSNTTLINEIVLDLRGGTALVDAIQRLQGSADYNNIPGLFWDLVEQGTCANLGLQCRQRVYDTILEGYIPVSDDIAEDVWLKSSDLNQWVSLLRNFESDNLSSLGGTKLREAFVFMLTDALEKVVRKPTYKDSKEPLEVYLQRKSGLPVSNTSPLFGYSLDDLRDDRTVPNCEIVRLAAWVNNVRQMLNIIYHGDLRPCFLAEPFPGECPSGSHIPFISGDIQSRPLGEDSSIRYDHNFQKAHVYWVPKEFLP